jgi:hypothetical protein
MLAKQKTGKITYDQFSNKSTRDKVCYIVKKNKKLQMWAVFWLFIY